MLDPRYAPALNEWANVLQDQGRYEAALGLYARALAIDPKRAVVHHNLGVAYRRLGYPERAEDAFRQALARDPGYVHSLEELALLYADTGRPDAAHSLLQRAGSPRAARILAELAEDPAGVLASLNRRFPMEEQNGLYFTMLYGVLDLKTLAFRFVSAGHDPVVHVPRAGAPYLVEGSGMAIGWVEEEAEITSRNEITKWVIQENIPDTTPVTIPATIPATTRATTPVTACPRR